MTSGEAGIYVGLALLYAALVSALLLVLSRMMEASIGWRADSRHALSLLLILFFIFLTQHPFPDRAALDCSDGGMPPLLQPFMFLGRFADLWARDAPLSSWLRDKVVMSSIMNFALCAAIGAALSRHLQVRRSYLTVLGFAVLLSGGIEISQVTGLFGVYPCAYRQFEVDDLILNIVGTCTGFALGLRLFRCR